MSSSKPEPLAGGANQGIWRDGKKLVVHRDATLPEICVKTNEPSQRKIKRKYYWHHPAVFFAILLHVFIYIILALVLRKRHDLEVPVTEETAGKRRNWIAIGWVLGLAGVALFVASIVWLIDSPTQSVAPYAITGIVVGFIMLLTGSIFASRAAGVLYPKKMTPSATWFKGANWEYLERFPEVPPNA